MKEFGRINTRIWTHPEFRAMSANAKGLILYLESGPESNALGCFYCPDCYLMAAFGFDQETIDQVWAEVEGFGWAVRGKGDWVLSVHYLEQHPPENGNIGKAIEKQFKMVPRWSSLIDKAAQIIINSDHGTSPEITPPGGRKGYRNGFRTVFKGFGNGFGTVSKRFPNGSDTLSKHGDGDGD